MIDDVLFPLTARVGKVRPAELRSMEAAVGTDA